MLRGLGLFFGDLTYEEDFFVGLVGTVPGPREG
jgi:hypothetical protein